MTAVLTGATGFLGLHLIRGLLPGHDRLVVLARGEPPTVLERLAGFCTAAGKPAEFVAALPERVRVVRGDVTEPCLGLPAVVFRPGILSTHLPPGPCVPSHPLLFASRALAALVGGPPDELPVAVLLDVLADALPIRFAVVPDVPDPSPLEAKVRLLSGAWAYARHRRRHDDARVRALVDVRPSRGRLDRRYLLAGIGR